MSKKFCIVIPVYKDTLDCVEEISIKRLAKVIENKDYQIYLVCPMGLNTQVYYKYLNKNVYEIPFEPKYFESTSSYSQLCILYDFYKSFSEYEYMYIYQLDCYLFYDKLEEWCDKGYDYIGGPILSTDCGWDTVKKHQGGKYQPYVGNGGFSLRKISTFMEMTDPDGELRKTYNLTDEYLSKVEFEDKYFCNDLYDFYALTIPNWQEALNFALDMSVDVVYNYFKWPGQPMCIHSVDKNIRWWKKVIPEFKDQKVIDFCEKKHEEFFKLYYDENDSTMRT